MSSNVANAITAPTGRSGENKAKVFLVPMPAAGIEPTSPDWECGAVPTSLRRSGYVSVVTFSLKKYLLLSMHRLRWCNTIQSVSPRDVWLCAAPAALPESV